MGMRMEKLMATRVWPSADKDREQKRDKASDVNCGAESWSMLAHLIHVYRYIVLGGREGGSGG